VEKEFAQATGRTDTGGLTDRKALRKILSDRGNRYLVRQLCWVFTIKRLETYLLLPHDPADLDLLAETVRDQPDPIDVDVLIAQPSATGQRELEEALNHATMRGVITVAAAGNQATVGSSIITHHPWVIPVVACNHQGRPMTLSNLDRSINRERLSAPGDHITSLGTAGKPITSSGTNITAPYVTGAVALLWSEFPDAKTAEVKFALTQTHASPRRAVVPPLMDA
jgi:hypothetical protein